MSDKVKGCQVKNNRSEKVEKKAIFLKLEANRKIVNEGFWGYEQFYRSWSRFIFNQTASKFLWCFLLLIILASSACSHKPNYAPVRKTQGNLNSNVWYHTVKKGETLYSIGFRYNYSYLHLAKWNNLSKPYRIHVGQKIRLVRLKNSQSDNSKITKNAPKKRTTSQNTPKKWRNTSQKKPILSKTKKNLLKLSWQWPIRGRLVKTFSQSGNKGIDISGKIGQSVKAAAGGKVVYSGNGLTGYGNLLIIKHNYLYLSAYANNHRLLVAEGQDVKKGQVVAEMGIGKGKQAALHFEIRKNGESVNPLNYLP